MAQHVTSDITTPEPIWHFHGEGFTSGDKYDYSTTAIPDDGSREYRTGGTQGTTADATGAFDIYAPVSALVPASVHRPLTLRSWIRPAGTPRDADPVMLTDGSPAVTEERVE